MKVKILSAAVVACLVGGVGYAVQRQSPSQQRQDPNQQRQARIVEIQQELLLEALYDAPSARLRDVESHGLALCGEVNAKNRFGGYTGYYSFVVTPQGEVYVGSNERQQRIVRIWCKSKS